MSTTRNNTKVCGDNVSLLTDTVHSLEVNQDFHFKKLDHIVERVILIIIDFQYLKKKETTFLRRISKKFV